MSVADLDICLPTIPTGQPLDVGADECEPDAFESPGFMSDISSNSEASFRAPESGNIPPFRVRANTLRQVVETSTARCALPRKKTTNNAGVQTDMVVPKDAELYG